MTIVNMVGGGGSALEILDDMVLSGNAIKYSSSQATGYRYASADLIPGKLAVSVDDNEIFVKAASYTYTGNQISYNYANSATHTFNTSDPNYIKLLDALKSLCPAGRACSGTLDLITIDTPTENPEQNFVYEQQCKFSGDNTNISFEWVGYNYISLYYTMHTKIGIKSIIYNLN